MKWIKHLFKNKQLNANNIDMIIKKAVEIIVKIEYEGFQVAGASGRFSHENKWASRPKITIITSDGKKNVPLDAPKAEKESRALISVMYCLCYLKEVTQSTNLYFSDNIGIPNSIATRHGPEKSEYMKALIKRMGDTDFIESMRFELSRPLPDDLSELHKAIIKAKVGDKLPDVAVEYILKKFDISCKELKIALKELEGNSNVDHHRIPEKVLWPSLFLPDHDDIVEDEVAKAIQAASSKVQELMVDLNETMTEMAKLHELLRLEKEENKWLLNRGLLGRIFNKKHE